MKTENPAFILGLYIPGIAIIKHLSGLGINTIGLSHLKESPGFALKRADIYQIPSPHANPQALVDWLVNKARQYPVKPVLYNTSDDYVQFLDVFQDSLKPHLLFPWESTGTAKSLSSKLELSRYAKQINVNIPGTYEVDGSLELNVDTIKYPCLIKPLYANEWRTPEMKSLIGSNKVIIINNKDEMQDWNQKLTKTRAKYLIQELIPGPDDRLFYCVVYRSRKGEIIRYFCGQKLRITPIHFGSASYVKTTSPDPFMGMIANLLDSNAYVGSAGIEFKHDSRDGKYKLIEINARYGLWDDISIDLGTDVFSAYYEDFTDQNPVLCIPTNKSVRWLSISRDIPDFYNYIKERQITWIDWIKTLMPPIKIAEYFKGELPLLLYLIFAKPLRKFRKIIHV